MYITKQEFQCFGDFLGLIHIPCAMGYVGQSRRGWWWLCFTNELLIMFEVSIKKGKVFNGVHVTEPQETEPL